MSQAEEQFLLVKVNELNNRADYIRELLVKIDNKLGFTSFDSESLYLSQIFGRKRPNKIVLFNHD
jgi:hypothetical protein